MDFDGAWRDGVALAVQNAIKAGEKLTEQCWECKKWITDQEWVINWGSCAACLDAAFAKYEEEHPHGLDEEQDPHMGDF